ncbi:MAG: gliding motility-associated C-terminal domain-containing protein [Flavobacteriales bacterium]
MPIELSLQVLPATCTDVCDGSAGVIPSGGVAPYTFLWSPAPGTGQGTANVGGLCAQAYTLTVTDAVGCDTTVAFTVDAPPAIEANATQVDVLCAAECNGSISLNTTGGTGVYTYVWTPTPPVGQGTANASGLCAGTWDVTITSGACDTTLTFQILEPLPLVVDLVTTDPSCSSDCDGTATATVSGGTAGFTFVWSPAPAIGQGTAAVSGLCAGNYAVLIADANGCDTTLVFEILENLPIVVDLALTPSGCDSLCAGTATATVSGGVGPYVYNWGPGTIAGQGTPQATGLCSGLFTLQVVDALGCDTTIQFLIAAPSGIDAEPLVSDVTCNGACDGTVVLPTTGGVAPYSWLWTPTPAVGQGTGVVSGLCAGVYTVLITDAVACDTTILVTVGEPQPLLPNGSSTNVTCNGPCDGSASVAPTGGTAPYTFNWVPTPPAGQGTPDATQLCPGDWSVTITDFAGCDTTVTFTILDQQPIDAGLVTSDALCSDACDGTASVTPSNGVAPYTFVWTPAPGTGQGTSTVGGLCAGSYNVLITDALGCDTTVAFTIAEPDPFTIDLEIEAEDCTAPCTGSAITTVSGATGPYTYLWQPEPGAGQGTPQASGLCAGTSYILTITDANACDTTISITVDPFPEIVPNSSSTPATCSNVCNGTATVGPTGGNSPYTYVWSPEPGAGQGTPQATGLCAGVVEVTITDADGCSTVASILILAPDPLSANATQQNIACAGVCDGSITLNVTGGTAPYLYAWSPAPPNGQGTAQATGLCAGVYTVLITDANGCTLEQSFTITEPAPLVISTVATESQCLLCNGSSNVIIAGGTIPFTVQWTDAQGTVIGTSDNIQNVCAGIYIVRVTDGNGCAQQLTVTIVDTDSELLTTTDGTSSCPGECDGEVSVTFACSDPPCTVEWTDAVGTPIGQTTETATALCAGSYLAVVTNASGCIAIEPAVVVDPAGLATAISSSPVSCAGVCDGTATIGVSGVPGSFTFAWSPEAGGGQGTPFATGLCAGVYTIDITDGNGCLTTVSVLILEPDPLALNGVATDVSCAGDCDGSITLQPSGGTAPYTYAWSPAPPQGQSGAALTGLCAGTWIATVTDANGCSISDSFTIVEPAELALTTNSTPSTCPVCDGTATVDLLGGTAPFAISWSLAGTPIGTDATITGLCGGLYTVTVVDGNGCSRQATVQIADPSGETLVPNNGQVSCANDCDGTVSVDLVCSAPPCVLQWTDAVGNVVAGDETVVNDLCVGDYTVQVTNADGCVSFATATVAPSQIITPNLSSSPVSCAGLCDGTATVGPVGGVEPYTFLWSNGADTPQATGLCAGVFSVTIGDQSGCDTTITVLILEPQTLAVTGVVQNVACAGDCNGTITATVSGGTAPYLYAWSPAPPAGQGTATASGLCAGSYTLAVTDANGCVIEESFAIAEPPALTLSATSSPSECGVCNGTIEVTAAGGTAPYLYLWTLNGAIFGTADSLSGLCAGLYAVQVIDANGCEAALAVPLSDIDGEETTTTDGLTTCPGDCDGAVSVDFICGDQPCTIAWFDGNGNDLGQSGTQLTDLCAGAYFVQVTNGIGCITIDTAFVADPDPIQPNLSTSPVSCFGDCDGVATVGPTGGSGTYVDYFWEPGTIDGQGTPQATGLCAGNYTVTITDTDGCSITSGVLILSPDILQATEDITPVACFGDCNGSITLNTQGGTLPYAYVWSPEPPSGQGTNAVQDLCPGTWSVSITDGNGCVVEYSYELLEPTPVVLDLTTTDNLCFGDCAGTATVVPSGGTPDYSILWTDADGNTLAQNIDLVDVLCNGIYNVQVSDTNGCALDSSFTIASPTAIDAGLLFTNETCFGPCDGTASVSPSGGTGPYVIFWQPEPQQGQGTEQVSGLCPGEWNVTITDVTGCDTTVTFTILPFVPIEANATVTDVLSGGECTGNISTAATGGLGGYTYIWVPEPPNGQGPEDSDLCAGTYQLTITDVAGCDSSFTFTITEPTPLVATVDDVSAASCADASDGSITTTVAGGTVPVTIAWTGPAGFSSTQEDISDLPPGTYTQTASDANGCSVVNEVVVDALSTVFADAGVDQQSCTGVAVILDGTASVGAISYTWVDQNGNVVGNDAVVDLGVLPPGEYTFTLTVTDGPCSSTDQVTVIVLALPIADAGPNQTIFLSESANLGGAPSGPPGSTFTWSPDSLLSNSTVPNPTADPTVSTWYTLTVVGPDGCISVDSVLITVVPDIVIPTGFTPNGDGHNETWIIDFIELFPNVEVEIYNRWGEMLFQSVGYRTPWDGRYSGGPVPVGTYYYVVKLNDPEFPDAFTGPLTVIR